MTVSFDALGGWWARQASIREIIRVAAAARSAYRGFVPEGTDMPEFAALLTLHRSGYTRQRGLLVLARSRDPFVLPFLLLRLDDIVPSLRAYAEEAARSRLEERYAAAWVRSLRLVELLRARKRGGGGRLLGEILSFLSGHPEALAEGAHDLDPLVRLRSFELRGPTALAEALRDADLRVRLWAARTTASKATTVPEKRALVPMLEASSLASMRLLALKTWAVIDARDDAPIERALLDHHAAVRYFARTTLRTRHPDRAFGDARMRAICVLEDPAATNDDVVGALGALADVGIREDAPRVEPFVTDGRRRVEREASRTLALLRA